MTKPTFEHNQKKDFFVRIIFHIRRDQQANKQHIRLTKTLKLSSRKLLNEDIFIQRSL